MSETCLEQIKHLVPRVAASRDSTNPNFEDASQSHHEYRSRAMRKQNAVKTLDDHTTALSLLPFLAPFKFPLTQAKARECPVHARGVGRLTRRCLEHSKQEIATILDIHDEVLVTWVPTSRRQAVSRGFNLAHIIAKEVARCFELDTAPLFDVVRTYKGLHFDEAFERWRGKRLHQTTRSQTRQARNTNGPRFRLKKLSKRLSKRLAQKSVRLILVDDVITTGSTLGELSLLLAHRSNLKCDFLTLYTTLSHGHSKNRKSPEAHTLLNEFSARLFPKA